MATAPKKRGGSVGAWIVTGLVAAAVVGAPFYLSLTRSDSDALDDAIRPDLQRIAARLVACDANIAGLADLRRKLADEVKLTVDAAVKTAERSRAALGDVERQLTESGRAISALDRTAPKGLGGTPSTVARNTFNELTKRFTENEAALRDADSRLKAVMGQSVGGAAARSDFAANALAALTARLQGQLAANRADLARRLASTERAAAGDLSLIARDARRRAREVAGRIPSDYITQLEGTIHGMEESLEKVESGLKRVEEAVNSREAEAKKARGTVQAAEQELARMNQAGQPGGSAPVSLAAFGSYRSEYVRWSDESRRAQVRADELENGALVGATVALPPDGDLLGATYSGGQVELGLVTLREVRDRLRESAGIISSGLEQHRKLLTEVQATAADLGRQRDEYTKLADECATAGEASMKRVHDWMSEARAAETQAVNAFDAAARSAQAAASAAQKRAQDAASIVRSLPPDKPNARLQELANDKDAEASARFLAAEVMLAAGDALVGRMGDLASAAQAVGADESKPKPSAEDAATGEARKKAVGLVDKAIDELTRADKLVGAGNYAVTVGATRLSGQHYRWQFQSALGAAHLLRSQLATTDGERRDELEKANQLLTEAAKGREGSPLLQPALDVIQYLHATAK